MQRLKKLLTVVSCCFSLLVDKPAAPPVKPEPFLLVYAPSWCGHCHAMQTEVKSGDARLRVYWIEGDPTKGDEKAFPKDVIAHAIQYDCWPVIHYKSPKGRGAFWHGRMTFNELLEIVKIEPSPLPAQPRVELEHYVWTPGRQSKFQPGICYEL